MLAVASPVKAAKLRESIPNRSKVAQKPFDYVRTTSAVWDTLRNELQFLQRFPCQCRNVGSSDNRLSALRKYRLAASLDEFLRGSDGETRVRLLESFHAPNLLCEVIGM